MITYPHIDPDIIRVGPVAIRWYGLMYLMGFAASYALVRHQVRVKALGLSREFLDSLHTYIILGLLIGARLGYVVFYNGFFYLEHPLRIFALWEGGMSFHGGLIGSVIGGVICCRRHGKDAWLTSDLIMVTAPIGLGLGRLGNFINGELYGRVTNAPWGMVFPSGGPLPRHPSQLYEFVLEGPVLFTVLWILKDRTRATGTPTALFILLYGIFRFGVEFFREPDVQLGYVLGFLTMGQTLSVGMMLVGVILLYIRRNNAAL